MAYLDGGRRDHAQILLLTALVLAVMFVALALILNSAIFTENLASRGEMTGGDDVIEYRNDLRHGTGTILRYENRNVSNGEGHDDVVSRLKTGIGDANEILTRQHAKHGAISNASLEGRGEGARIYQTDASRNFTNASGQEDWTVVQDVDRTRAFRINVTRASRTCTLLSDCFTIVVDDGVSDDWKLSVNDSGVDEYRVRVENSSGEYNCGTVNAPTVEIDITDGVVGGQECSALSFDDTPDSGYDIEYRNADTINGTYSFVVDNDSVATPTHFDTGPGPSVSPALYNVTLAYEYETADVAVESEIPIAPGEPDE